MAMVTRNEDGRRTSNWMVKSYANEWAAIQKSKRSNDERRAEQETETNECVDGWAQDVRCREV